MRVLTHTVIEAEAGQPVKQPCRCTCVRSLAAFSR